MAASCFNRAAEEHIILTYNGCMFSLPRFRFKIKSVNISTISTSKVKKCVCVWRVVSWLSLGTYFLSVIV